MAFLLPPAAASIPTAALPSVTRRLDTAVLARRPARIGTGARMSSDSTSAATAADASGIDPPLAPVPSRAGRVKVRRGWSNTTGELIRQVYDWLTIDVGGKTTVIRLPDGSLFVHAPLLVTASLKRELAALGPVSVIVVPNTEHVDGAAQWVAAYPDAVALGPPGYAARSGLPLTDIPVDNAPHPAFGGVIEHTFFGSMPLFSESVFFHRPSGTLMVTDLYWNWPLTGVPARTRFFAAGMDWVYKPVYEALLVRDKSRWAAEEMGRVLGWGGERIIPCHGDVLEGVDVSEVLRAFYASLLQE